MTCGCIDVETLARDRDQLWAEAKARFEAGSVWWLDTAELIQLASDQQVDRYEGDPGKKSSLRGSKRGRACPSARCSKNALPSRRPSGRKRTRSGRRGACEPKAGAVSRAGGEPPGLALPKGGGVMFPVIQCGVLFRSCLKKRRSPESHLRLSQFMAASAAYDDSLLNSPLTEWKRK